MKNFKQASRLAVLSSLLLATVLTTGCNSDDSEKASAITMIIDACEPGNTVSFTGYTSTWGSGVEATCTWVKQEKPEGS